MEPANCARAEASINLGPELPDALYERRVIKKGNEARSTFISRVSKAVVSSVAVEAGKIGMCIVAFGEKSVNLGELYVGRRVTVFCGRSQREAVCSENAFMRTAGVTSNVKRADAPCELLEVLRCQPKCFVQ